MKILMTGGTGFVGTALRRELHARGHEVRLFVRRSSVGKIEAGKWDIIAGDVLDTHACLRACAGVDAVVHLVGIRREQPEAGTTYEVLHTEATYGIVDAARRSRVSRFIHMSALGTRENAPSRYHQTKWEAEEIVRRSGMRWTIFRPSVIFGPGDEFHPLLADLVRRPIVPLVDGGKSLLQPVALSEVVSAMASSVTMPETQGSVVEVGGADRVPFIEIVEAVARSCDVWPNYWRVSSWLMKPMVKMMQRFRGFPLTYDELTMLLEDNVCDNADFTRMFGIEPASYREAMRELVNRPERATA